MSMPMYPIINFILDCQLTPGCLSMTEFISKTFTIDPPLFSKYLDLLRKSDKEKYNGHCRELCAKDIHELDCVLRHLSYLYLVKK